MLFVGRRFRPGSCRSTKRNWGNVSACLSRISDIIRLRVEKVNKMPSANERHPLGPPTAFLTELGDIGALYTHII